MSYDEERMELFKTLKKEVDEAYEVSRKHSVGRDGLGTKMNREATERYNAALIALKKKYKKDQTE